MTKYTTRNLYPKVGIDLLVLYTLRLCRRALRGDVDVGIFIVNILDPRRDNVVIRDVWPECSRIKSVITNSSVLCVGFHPHRYNWCP